MENIEMEWRPKHYHDNPQVNATLNVAASLFACAEALSALLYGLRQSPVGGRSIAEAIEIGMKPMGEALQAIASNTDPT